MNKISQYGLNVAVASWNATLAPFALYTSNPQDDYFYNVMLAFDELGNALTGGDPGETISSRAGKAREQGQEWACVLCAFLAWVTQTNHCQQSIEPNEGSKAVIPD
jgi:hypothetical protein